MLFLRFLLIGFKISAEWSEERNNRATGRGKQGYYFHRKIKYLFQTVTVTINSGFERYSDKQFLKKILWKIVFFLYKQAKTDKQSILFKNFGKDEILVSKGNTKLKTSTIIRFRLLL